MTNPAYTTMLNAGIGMLDETRILLNLWQPGMSLPALRQAALESGQFPKITARRLRNFVAECFGPRYLAPSDTPARLLQKAQPVFSNREFNQLLFLYACRESRVLCDFVNQVYWPAYASGKATISNVEALDFVIRANQDGKTAQPWSENSRKRVARYLTSSCADFGLLEDGQKIVRKVLPYQIESDVFAILAYDLHFAGHGDNAILSHCDWALFGLDRGDVFKEFKRQALKGWWIFQSAGDVTRIGWQFATLEELMDGLAQG